tara:strand:+ start:1070 stop:1642 length:573 start_codon:yes stop_codon:yes gene_type:complete
MGRRQKVRRRRRLFVGCEGESEQGYAALLQRFSDEQGGAVHAESRVVPRAGDPLAIVERAIEMAAQGERGSKPAYSVRFLMLDTDLLGNNPGRDAQIDGLVERHNFVLLRQNCCFEAFLLRHFVGHANDEPPTAAIALTRLQAVWPQYKKGFPAQELRKQIALEDVQRAAQSPRNADFSSFLDAMGLQPH